MTKRLTAGQLSHKAASDKTKYNAREVGEHLSESIAKELKICVENHYNIIDEREFCVVMVISTDPLISNLMRRKFYAWPYLPSPRPNQSVFLYNKVKNQFTKRLWVLPSAMVMAELACTSIIVDKVYQTMQAWSVAFFKGTFWEYIRHEHNIDMLSEHEFFLANREKLIEAGCKPMDATYFEPFDFSKIGANNIVEPVESMVGKFAETTFGKVDNCQWDVGREKLFRPIIRI